MSFTNLTMEPELGMHIFSCELVCKKLVFSESSVSFHTSDIFGLFSNVRVSLVLSTAAIHACFNNCWNSAWLLRAWSLFQEVPRRGDHGWVCLWAHTHIHVKGTLVTAVYLFTCFWALKEIYANMHLPDDANITYLMHEFPTLMSVKKFKAYL